jgi:hypothetical protein
VIFCPPSAVRPAPPRLGDGDDPDPAVGGGGVPHRPSGLLQLVDGHDRRRLVQPGQLGHLGLCQIHWQRVQQSEVLARRDADLLQGRRHLCREDMPGVLQKAGEIRGGAAAVSGVKERV